MAYCGRLENPRAKQEVRGRGWKWRFGFRGEVKSFENEECFLSERDLGSFWLDCFKTTYILFRLKCENKKPKLQSAPVFYFASSQQYILHLPSCTKSLRPKEFFFLFFLEKTPYVETMSRFPFSATFVGKYERETIIFRVNVECASRRSEDR